MEWDIFSIPVLDIDSPVIVLRKTLITSGIDASSSGRDIFMKRGSFVVHIFFTKWRSLEYAPAIFCNVRKSARCNYLKSLTKQLLDFQKSFGYNLKKWSGRLDLNQRPLSPQNSALPGCATARLKKIMAYLSRDHSFCPSYRQKKPAVFCLRHPGAISFGRQWTLPIEDSGQRVKFMQRCKNG